MEVNEKSKQPKTKRKEVYSASDIAEPFVREWVKEGENWRLN
jgi:hypothetical protein